jgi:protoporphyrinogen oxidase
MDPIYVVGGGLAGLAAAITLAQAGRRVTLVEKSKQLGGMARTEVREGFHLNFGPHALMREGVAARALAAWGVRWTGHVTDASRDAYLVRNGELIPGLAGPADLVRFTKLSVRERVVAGLLLGQARPAFTRPSETLAQWLDRHSPPLAVRQLLETFVRVGTYCGRPDCIGAREAFAQFNLALRGVVYVDGGWQRVVRGLQEKAESLHARIETGSAVDEVGGGHVLVNGERRAANGVVLAISPAQVERVTGRKLPEMTPMRMASLALALRPSRARDPWFALGWDQPFYLSDHARFSAVAPTDHSLVYVGRYLTDSATHATVTRGLLEAYADQVLPSWRSRLIFAQYLPQLTVSHAIPGRRPDVDGLRLPGVSVAGDWVSGPGDSSQLADAAVASGIRAAQWLVAGARWREAS